MRKIILIAVILLIVTSVYAEEGEHLFTNGLANGRVYFENSKSDEDRAGFYIAGILAAKPDIYDLYPNCTMGDIESAVKAYYKNNPTKAYRPILEVLESGCK